MKTFSEHIDLMEHKNFFEYADYPCICQKLDISEGFWNRELANKDSAFGQAIKKYMLNRNSLFFGMQKELDPARWIFLAKNWLGMKDNIGLPGEDGEPIKITLIPADEYIKKQSET